MTQSSFIALSALLIATTTAFAMRLPSLTAGEKPFRFEMDAKNHPVVQTENGPIFGYTDTFGGAAFLGVPYAAPPIGDLRFKAPADMTNWTAPRNATEFGPGCYQHCNGDAKLRALMCTPKISEDCLFLNVFTPPANQSKAGEKWAVYFFIHGGMFTWGSGGIPLYKGSEWARRENIVIVTINYRLGIFGALTTKHVQGNFNILDQRRALKWVHDNIGQFGGDKDRVTVSGQSAGATSTGIHYTSPGSWPYFARALIISDPYGLQPFTKKMATSLGEVVLVKVGCEFDDAAQQLSCLQNLTSAQLLELAHTDILPTPHEVLGDMMQWVPHVDGTVIPQQPLEAMRDGNFARVPLYTSDTVNETIPFIIGPVNFKTDTFLVDVALDYVFGFKIAGQVMDLYGPVPEREKNDTRPFFSRILTDYLFVCPSRYSMLQAAKRNVTVYNAIFDDHPSWARWYNGKPNAPCTKWVCHAFDLPSIFDTYWVLEKYMKEHNSTFPHPTPEENKLAIFTQSAYGSFVRTGKMDASLNWPEYKNETSSAGVPPLTSYNYSVPVPTQHIHSFRAQFCDFWDSIGYNRF